MNQRILGAVVALGLMVGIVPVQAASPITYRYTYDAAGQLTSAIDSTGVVLQYAYDSEARLIQTTRTAPGGPLSILGVSPASGAAGTTVTILGSGFSAVAANNTVTFNGVAAVVTAATANTLTMTVPPTATTGAISVTTASVTATSPSAFQVVALPQITSISTRYLLAGQTGVTITLTGVNLTAATFSVQPSTTPAAITIDNAQATATSATLTVSTAALALNAVIVATNGAGSSSIVPGSSNSLTLLLPTLDSDGDGLSNADELNLYHTDPLNPDTDGDGMRDGWEVRYGLNPLDPSDAAKPSNAADGLTNLQEFLGGTDPSNADRTVPTVTSFTPSASGTGIPVNTVISLNFNRPVLSGAQLATLAALNPHVSSPAFSVSSSAGPVAGAVNISFNGVTFVPAQDLNANTTYTLAASGFRTSASGVLQAATFTSSFTTGAQRDTTQPTVIRTSPSNFYGAVTTITAVPTNAPISIEFSKPIDPATLTAASFQVNGNDSITFAAITGRYITDSTRLIATFIPDLPLPVGSQIFVNFDTQAVKDTAGNSVTGPANLSFQTGFGPNTTPPNIAGFSPRNSDTGVPANAQIVVGFSRPVSEIAAVRAITVTANALPVPGSFTFLNNDLQAVFIPANPLAPGATSVTVSTGLTDVAGNALAGSSSAAFTVDSPANTTLLTITSTSPPDGATAGINAVVQAAFSARIDPLTVVVSMFRTVVIFNQNSTSVPVAGATVASSDLLSAAFTPSQPLLETTQYCWTVSAADVSGNSVTSGQSCFTTTATSDTTAPAITGVNPPANSTNIPLNAVIAAQASKPLSSVSVANNAATAITLSASGTPVVGAASLSTDGLTLVFTPAAPLTANVTYAIAVAGVTDYEGNTITPFSSTFTAGAAPDTSPLTISSFAPADGAPNVPVNSAVVISFNKLVNPLLVNANTVAVSVPAKNVILAGSYSVDNSGAGGIISFKPSTPFPGGVSIAVNINGVQDFAGNPAAGGATFTTAASADTTPPTVTSVTPTNGSSGLGQNTLVSLTFSKPLNPTTIGSGTFALFSGTTRLQTTVGSSQDFQTVTLSGSIPGSAIISVTATSDVQDLAGNSLGGFTSSFSTAPVNVTSPTITGQRPGFGATAVPVSAPIALFASKPLNPATVNGAVHVAVNGQPVTGTVTLSSSNQGIQFTPAAPWSPGATVQIFLDSTATDTDGNTMVNYQGSFTTAPDLTAVAPIVVSMVPNFFLQSSNPLIEVQFSKAIDASTLTGNISLLTEPGDGAVPAAVSLVTPQIVRVTPASALAANASYIVKIATGLKDTTGLSLPFENDLSFITGSAPDTAQPRVVDITPPDTFSNIGTNVPIEIRFDKPVNPLSVSAATIQVMAAGHSVGPVSISFNNSQSGFINQNVQIVPIGLLPDSAHVTVAVSGVQDLSGNTVVPVSIGFNTGTGFDLTLPAVISTNPASGATGVPTNSILTIQFDKPIDPYSINAQSIQIADNVTGQVAGAYSMSANALQMSFVPDAPLAVGRTYTVYIAANGDVHDLAGNLLPYSTITFTAGFGAATAPHVILTDPRNTLSSVPVNSAIQILFDEPLQSASINSVSLSAAGSPVAGTVNSLSLGNTVLTLTPPALLRGSTAYSISITGVMDLAGNTINPPVTTTFTTAPGARLTATTYAADPPDGAANIGRNVVPAIFPTAPLDPISVNSSSLQLFSPDLNTSTVPISGATATAADRMSATFTPSAPLKPTTRYCLKVLGITDDTGAAINAGGGNYLNSTCFVTGAGNDTTRPTVTSVSPPNTSTNVPANVSITIITSEPIDAATVKSGSVTLAGGGSNVPGTLTLASDSETITFQPSATLAASTSYTLTVSGFTDFEGNLVVPFTSGFQTDSTGVPDLTQPTVISTAPAAGATGVANSGPVSITFSKPVNPISVNVNTIAFTLPSGAQLGGTLATSGAVVTFTPATPMPANATITGTVDSLSNVLDFAGNAAQSFIFSFTTAATADTTAPVITSITPAAGATNMGSSAVVTVIFSKSLDPSTINNATFGLFAGSTRLTLNSLTSSQDHTVVSMNASPLPASSTITAVITHGVLDLSGNALQDFTSNFTTAAIDTTRPQVSLYRPAYGSSSVPPNAPIEIFFTTPMDPTSVSSAVTVSQNGSVIAGTTALTGGGQTLTFTPSAPFAQGAVVQVFAGSSAMDLLGNQLMPVSLSFTVAPDLTGVPPSVVGTSPTDIAPLNTIIQVQFNKPLDPATVNSTALLLTTSPDGTPVAGSVTLVGDRTIQMIPASALQPSANYMYSVPVTVTDKTGLSIEQPFTGYLSTGTSADTSQPRVVAVTPPDASVGIGDNAPVKVQFNKSINLLTATAAAIQVKVNGSPVTPVSVTYDSLPSVSITPFSPFPDNTKVTVSVAGVLDAAGNTVVPFTSSFTTGAAPVLSGHVLRTSPVPNAVNVPRNAIITLETDDPVDPSTVNSNGFGVYDASGTIAGTRSISANGKVISFAPAAPFAASDKVSFYASLLDLEGNYLSVYDASGKVVIGDGTFTTSSAAVTTPPSVTLVNPPNGLAGVPTDIVPQLLFSEPLNASTIGAITLSHGGTNLALTRTIGNGNQTVSLIPPGLLQPSTTYAVTVGGVADTAGNIVTTPVPFSFTTGTGASLGTPSAVSFSPANNATGVPLSVNISVVFSAPLNPLTLNATSFALYSSGYVDGSLALSADGLTVTFTPSVALNPNSNFEILVSNGAALTDVAGNAVTVNSTFFTTGAQ